MDFYFAKICSYRRRVDDVFLRHAGEMGSANGNPDAPGSGQSQLPARSRATLSRQPVFARQLTGLLLHDYQRHGDPQRRWRRLSSDSNAMRRTEHVNACMKLEGWENKNKVTGLLAFYLTNGNTE